MALKVPTTLGKVGKSAVMSWEMGKGRGKGRTEHREEVGNSCLLWRLKKVPGDSHSAVYLHQWMGEEEMTGSRVQPPLQF